VFIDEIDKIAVAREIGRAPTCRRQGVQRDLLPLVEGTTGQHQATAWCKTDHILFIASGAFHLAKPSDLIPELQGRLPIRVELQSLSVQDFVAILDANPCLAGAPVPGAAGHRVGAHRLHRSRHPRLAQTAFDVNERTENIGARRLSTVMERLLEEVSFNATTLTGQTVTVDAAYVDARLGVNQPRRGPVTLHLVTGPRGWVCAGGAVRPHPGRAGTLAQPTRGLHASLSQHALSA
jgi:ATP-dependent HslUV protease ATP-binding subunit HslU